MNQEHEELIAKEWEASRAQRESLRDNGATATFSTLPGFEKAFTKNSEHFSALCIDEGCTGEGTHLAGSGCGLSEEELLQQLRDADVTEFTTHEGCGAWALAKPELKAHEEKETAVITWGQDIAHKLGVPHRHITAAEMKRPAALHNAFYALYDTKGCFNRDLVPDMGSGFVTSPKYFASAKDNIELAVNIAFGPHGFGEKFTAEHPFTLVGIVDSNNAALTKERILADLSEVKEKFAAGRIIIDLIEAPVNN